MVFGLFTAGICSQRAGLEEMGDLDTWIKEELSNSKHQAWILT